MNIDATTKIDLLIAMALAARSDIRDGADAESVLDELRALVLWRCFDVSSERFSR